MKILIVDDSSVLKRFLARVIGEMEDIPVELIETSTGPEALAAVEPHGSPIDLMLCDLGIPEIDGLSVLKTVKARPDSGTMTVVMMTGDMSDETVSKALAAGAAGFLVKPFSQDEVTRLVREVHSRSKRG